jgi:SOS-response transcriptional repressor LexA
MITAKVQSAPLNSELQAGDLLTCQPVEDHNPFNHCGPLVIVEVDGKTTIGRLRFERGYYLLQPLAFTPAPVLLEPQRINVLAIISGVERTVSV